MIIGLRALVLTALVVPVLRADVTYVDTYTSGVTYPARLAATAGGGIYVTDPPDNQVTEYDAAGNVVATHIIPESPVGIAVHPSNGSIFLSRADGVIGIYDASFNLIGTCDPTPFTLVAPNDLAVDSANGEVYAVDSGAHRVLVFDGDSGTLVRAWGTQGTGLAQFESPQAIAVDSQAGHVIVADVDNFRIQVFDTTGVLQFKFGYRTLYTSDGQITWMARSEGLAIDSCGDIYLADALMGTVRIFSASGVELDPGFAPPIAYGSAPGQLRVPCDVLIAGGRLYIADTNNAAIDVYDVHCAKLSMRNALSPRTPSPKTAPEHSGCDVAPPDNPQVIADAMVAGRYDAALDLNCDKAVDIDDLKLALDRFGAGTPQDFLSGGEKNRGGYDAPHIIDLPYQCGRCHSMNDMPGGMLSAEGQENLCLSCHSAGKLAGSMPVAGAGHANSHVWGEPASSADVPGPEAGSALSLHLDNGNIRCGTCHEPHDGTYDYLRVDASQGQLCKECHRGSGAPIDHAIGQPFGPEYCTDCHDMHADGDNAALIKERMYSWYNGTTVDVGFTDPTVGVGDGGFVDPDAGEFGFCDVCHAYYDDSQSPPVVSQEFLDLTPVHDENMPACTLCHGHWAGFDPHPDGYDQVHFFLHNAGTGEYIVGDETFTQSDVDRDMAGQICSKCHPSAIGEVKDSVHFKEAGRTDRVLFPGGGAHGMLDRACGLPATTGLTNFLSDVNLGECAKCHVGRYMPVMEGFFAAMFGQMGVADPAGQAEQLVNGGIDCLICHAAAYRSWPEGTLAALADYAPADAASPGPIGYARLARDNGDFDHDGMPDLVIDMDGDGVMDAPLMYDSDGDGMPDTMWPTVAQDRSLAALSSIGPTTEQACLRCHEHARTGYKRGTLFEEGYDVHATLDTGPFAGAANQCTVCHNANDHKFVRGHLVSGDLAAADYPPPPPGVPTDPNDPTDISCIHCHDASALPEPIHSERHLAVIACETCHIPVSSGITYSLFGQGGHLSFGRDAEGYDTKLVTADHYGFVDNADRDADYEAYQTRPVLMWFDGGTSFLAQSLAVRGMPNAKITPLKPMGNGMMFDARFFDGVMLQNEAGADYNAYSMYRFFANGSNAEAFAALGMLDMTPTEVRNTTLADFSNPNPDFQMMAAMQLFPNLVYFDKADFGFEHYLTRKGSPWDTNGDGIIDAGQPFFFDMFTASNAGLMQFMGFNGPMGFPPDYEWYPFFDDVSQVISMKLPDGSLMKMFLQMQAANLPPDQQSAFLAAVDNYPAFSNGITLGGHGVRPVEEALGYGADGCLDCHSDNGVMSTPVPVTRKIPTDLGPMGIVELPVYQWKYYNLHALVDLGLSVQDEDVVAGTADVDIRGNSNYLQVSDTTFVLNWFMPNDPAGYRRADDPTALAGTTLTPADLTWSGGSWMPVLEPVVDMVPNYAVLGYAPGELSAFGLHGSRQGKATFYAAENGGFENITGIPMSDLHCQKCHAANYADGTPVDPATYTPSCRDCHADPANPGPVADDICYGCHARQGAEGGLGLPDVHRDAGMGCTDCHPVEDMHGDGTRYASMLEGDAIHVECEDCHPNPGSNPAHDIHMANVDCSACHTQSVISCYNCHFQTMVEQGEKKFFGPPRTGFKFLIKRDGKVRTASFQSAVYQGQSFYVLAPYTAHSISPTPADCDDCHGNAAITEYNNTGQITVTQWDPNTATLNGPTGVIPIPPDWQTALKFDHLDYDPNSDSWFFLKGTTDLPQMMYGEPLDADTLQKLAVPH